MKLFLASSADKTLSLLKGLVPNVGTEVLFVANAADLYSDAWWVDLDRKAFEALGFRVRAVDLRDATAQEFTDLLAQADILHVCGGSVYYLMSLLRNGGFEEALVHAVRTDTVVYTGTSAGSIVVSADLQAVSYDPEESEQIRRVPDHRGMGLVTITIMPHANQPAFIEENKRVVEHIPANGTALIFLTDYQALWVVDDTFRIVEAEKE